MKTVVQQVMTLKDAAAYLSISKAHLSNLINGKIEASVPFRVVRVGRRVLLRQDWIDEWLEATRHQFELEQRLTSDVKIRPSPEVDTAAHERKSNA